MQGGCWVGKRLHHAADGACRATAAVLPHPQAERQAGPDGDCHSVQLVGRDPRRRQRRIHTAVDGGLMRLLRQLGHHAAPGCVDVSLRGQRLAQDAAAGCHNRHARVVAAALNAQHQAGPAGGGKVLCAYCIDIGLCLATCYCCCCF